MTATAKRKYKPSGKEAAGFNGRFEDTWIKNCLLPDKDNPNHAPQWAFLEKHEGDPPRSLALIVSHGGTKSWRVYWYDDEGRSKSAKLGRYPSMSLAQARTAAVVYDPDAAAKAAAEEAAKKAAGTFKEVAENFIELYVDVERLRNKHEIERQLNKHILPAFGHRRMHDIKRRDVTVLLDSIQRKHDTSMTDHVLATISKIMNWHADRDGDYISPVSVAKMKRHKRRPRDRALKDDEIRALWKACEHKDVDPIYGAMLKLLLLTGQRRDKVRTMLRTDLDGPVWTIRRDEREKGAPIRLKLPQTAVTLLEKLDKVDGNPHVFPGRGKAAFNSFSQRKVEIDKVLEDVLPGMPAWTVHDLRRTSRQLLTRCEVPFDVAERVLGHSLKGVHGVYDSADAYGERIDKALAMLASEIEGIVRGPSGGNVVPLRG